MSPRQRLAAWCAALARRLDPGAMESGDYLIIGKDGTRIEMHKGLHIEGSVTFSNHLDLPDSSSDL